MHRVFIGIGSNIDRHIHIPQVLCELQELLSRMEISPVFQTSAVGFEGEDFYNLVVAGNTELTPSEVFAYLRALEDKHGRVRKSENQFLSRTLDLDLLLYDNQQIDDGLISTPHDDIIRYAFVLKPLADIAGEMLHPALLTSFTDLWEEFDKQGVELLTVSLNDIKPSKSAGIQ